MKTKKMFFEYSRHDFGNKLKYCVIFILCVSLMSCDFFDNAFDNVFDNDKTNDENRSGNVSLSMSLESYPEQIVAPGENLKQTKSASNPVRSPLNSGDTEVMTGNLSARNLDTGEEEFFDFYVSFNKDSLEAISSKTLNLFPGKYNFSILLENDAGSWQYAGEAKDVDVRDGDNGPSMSIRPIIGDRVSDVTVVTVLNEFKLEYPEIAYADFSDPKIGVVVDGGGEQVLSLDKNSGKSPAYINVAGGAHDIRLNLYDAQLQRGKSAPAQESVIIVSGSDVKMDIVPLVGKTYFSLPVEGGEASFKFEIPAIVVQEAGGIDEVRAVHSVVGEKNSLKESSLTLTATPEGNYRAEVVYSDFHYGEVTQTLEFYDNDPDEKIGYCAQTFSVGAGGETLLCELTLRRRAVIGGHLLANIGINVFDGNHPVAGAVVYFNGKEIGVSGSDAFATAGYLEHFPIRGENIIRVEYQDKLAEKTVSLEVLEVGNIDLHLKPSLEVGLVAHYPFNGDADDESGSGNKGVSHGVALTADRFGNADTAYAFDGIDDYILVPHKDILNSPNGLTITAWIKPKSTMGPRAIVSKWNDDTFRHSYIFKDHNSSDKLRIELSKGHHNDLADVSTTTSIPIGKWTFVATTYDRNYVKLYFNGVEESYALKPGRIADSDVNLLIGAVYTGGGIREFFDGAIDDIRIYNRALSIEEIAGLHKKESISLDSGLVAHYPFNGDANDESEHGNDGVVHDAALATDRFGNPNSAYGFDGVNGCILAPSSPSLNIQGSISLIAWVKDQGSNHSSTEGGMILARHYTHSARAYALFDSEGVSERSKGNVLQLIDGNNVAYETAPVDVSENEWHMLAGIYDKESGIAKLYVDGNLTVTQNFGAVNLMQTSVPLSIGCYLNSNDGSVVRGFFTGVIDDVRVYNRALSESEIKSLHKPDIVCPTDYDPVCGSDGRTYSNSCVAGSEGIFSHTKGECVISIDSPSSNLAKNTMRTGYPSVVESSNGWGGGSDKWDIVDGKRSYTSWANGLAFTGGQVGWAGQPAGWRHVVLDFGENKEVNRVIVWHFRTQDIPSVVKLEYWNAQQNNWTEILSSSDGYDYLLYPVEDIVSYWPEDSSVIKGVYPMQFKFPAVASSKIRFSLNNSPVDGKPYIEHGWIYEIEAYND